MSLGVHLIKGSTDINMNALVNPGANGINLVRYHPITPNISVEEVQRAIDEGTDIYSIERLNVTEEAEFAICGASYAEAITQKENIERVLREAEAYVEDDAGDPLYWTITPEESATSWRYEVLSAKWNATEGYNEWQAELDYIVLVIVFTRRFYCERTTEQALTLGNSTGQSASGVTVYNHDDSDTGQDNYVEISNTAVDGTLPSPARIEIENNYNNGTHAATFWLAQNVHTSPATFTHMLEAESATGGSTTSSDATSSGGVYRTNTATTTEAVMMTWTLSQALLDLCLGRYFMFLIRFRDDPAAGTLARFKIRDSTGVYLWEGEQVTLTAAQIQELGSSRIPPLLIGQTGIEPLELQLWAEAASGTTDLKVDYVQLTPLDGLRILQPRSGAALAYQQTLVDDSAVDAPPYVRTSSNTKRMLYTREGLPIYLWPKKTQRLYFLHTDADGNGTIARTSSIKVYHRPRKLVP